MTWLRTLAVLAGLGVAAWLAWEVGPAALIGELRRLSWRLGLLMLPQALVSVLDAAGWRYGFPGRLPPLGPLITMRLAGEAVSDTTPTGTLGGDALKAWLAGRAGIPLRDGLVSVVVAKTALVGSQVLFLVQGLALVAIGPAPSRGLHAVLAILAGVGALASAGFVWAQRHGLFRVGGRALGWLGLPGGATGAAARLDEDLRTYYRERRGRLLWSVALHLLGWMVGALEVWLALGFLGVPIPMSTALVIEAAATGIRSAGFLVPGSLGIQEGGLVGIFAALGLGGSMGLTFGVIRRIREAVWALAGYACLVAWRAPGRPRVRRPPTA